MRYTRFPERVWEPTSAKPDGTLLWSSRQATKEDRERRDALVAQMRTNDLDRLEEAQKAALEELSREQH